MKKFTGILVCICFIVCMVGCKKVKDGDVLDERPINQAVDTISKKELIKYRIDEIDYFNMKNSIYSIDSYEISLTFYDINLLKEGTRGTTCNLSLTLNGEEYVNETNSDCTYMFDRIDDTKMEIDFHYKKGKEWPYGHGSMIIAVNLEGKGKILTFRFKDGREIKVNNSIYQQLLNLNLEEVLIDDKGQLYTIDGSPIYIDCIDTRLCNKSQYSKINLDNYIVKDFVDEEENRMYPDIEYLDNEYFGGNTSGLTFYKDFTCKAFTVVPNYYAEHYFTDCNYKLSKIDEKTYLLSLTVAYYYDIQHNIEEHTILFDAYAKKGKIVALISNSYEAVSVFQDYNNYEGKIEMYSSH